MDLREGWLANLLVGDKVKVVSHSTAKEDLVEVVKQITPTGRIIVGSVRYEPNGRVNIGAWQRKWLEPIAS